MTRQPQSYPLIPNQVFLNIPQPADIARVKQRLIFEGGSPFSALETQKLAEFQNYLEKSKTTLDPYWNQPNRLRFLQSCEYQSERTVKDMKSYIEWIQKQHPLRLTPQIEEALYEGLIYYSGRDGKYRPIIVFDVKKTLDKNIPSKLVIDIYTYFLDFVVKNLLVEGHAENWVLVVDLNGSGVFNTIGMLREVLAAMSIRFRCRMHSCHIVRCPGAFSFLWALVKKFLDDATIQKISFTSKNKPDNLLAKTNPYQLQRKYAGAMEDVVDFWPITNRYMDYSVEGQSVELLTVDQYQQLYINQQLSNQKINRNFIKVQTQDPQVVSPPTQVLPQIPPKESQILPKEPFETMSIKPAESKTTEPTVIAKSKPPSSRKTLYDLHPSSLQAHREPKKIVSEKGIPLKTSSSVGEEVSIEEEGTINKIVHFVCNSKKPLTFSSYAM